MCAVNFSDIKFVMMALNDLLFFCWSTLGALATEPRTFSATARMTVILFWHEVEEEEDVDDENSIFPGLMKMEEEEEPSLFTGLMKMEADEEE
jgi:hypothetical protein